MGRRLSDSRMRPGRKGSRSISHCGEPLSCLLGLESYEAYRGPLPEWVRKDGRNATERGTLVYGLRSGLTSVGEQEYILFETVLTCFTDAGSEFSAWRPTSCQVSFGEASLQRLLFLSHSGPQVLGFPCRFPSIRLCELDTFQNRVPHAKPSANYRFFSHPDIPDGRHLDGASSTRRRVPRIF